MGHDLLFYLFLYVLYNRTYIYLVNEIWLQLYFNYNIYCKSKAKTEPSFFNWLVVSIIQMIGKYIRKLNILSRIL